MQVVCLPIMMYGAVLLCISSKWEHIWSLKSWKASQIFWLEAELDQKDEQALICSTLTLAKLIELLVRSFKMQV